VSIIFTYANNVYTVVSRIYAPAPRFATLALAENFGGGGGGIWYAGSDILSREYAPSSGATPRCSHITDRYGSWLDT